MSDATRIAPTPTRQFILDALGLAERLTGAAALTQDADLMQAAQFTARSAWLALERFDQNGTDR